jgi:hypothetical protein
MRDIGNMNAYFEVAIRERPGVKSVIDILTVRWINGADQKMSQVLAANPAWVGQRSRNFPFVAFWGEAVQYSLGKWAVLDVILQ